MVGVIELRSDVAWWRSRLSNAEPTYCQGVANKAAKLFEALIKELVKSRVAATGRSLDSLLTEIKYKGNATTIDKLPLGTVTQLLLALTKHDSELKEACPTEIRKSLSMLVNVRNETTHELASRKMRSATFRLLDLIECVLAHDAFVALLARAR